MAIKKLTISFDIDMEVFMKMLQHGNSSMNIQVLGDKPKVKEAKGPKLLAPPTSPPLRTVALNYFKERKDAPVPIKDLRDYCTVKGFQPNSAYQIIALLISNKHVKKVDKGLYQITAAGVAYHG